MAKQIDLAGLAERRAAIVTAAAAAAEAVTAALAAVEVAPAKELAGHLSALAAAQQQQAACGLALGHLAEVEERLQAEARQGAAQEALVALTEARQALAPWKAKIADLQAQGRRAKDPVTAAEIALELAKAEAAATPLAQAVKQAQFNHQRLVALAQRAPAAVA